MAEHKSTAVAKVTERTKPTFVTIGKNQVLSSGAWNNSRMMEYVLEHGASKWLTVADLARAVRRHASPANQDYVRKRLATLFNGLLIEHGRLLVIEYGPPHNQAKAVKLYDPEQKSEVERQAAMQRVERMRRRFGWSLQQYDRVISIINNDQDEPAAP